VTSTPINSYRDLLVWKAAIELAAHCYEATNDFPPSEIYGMTSQMRRASVSVAANIAEGHGRDGTAHFVQFLRVAQGSLKELETHLTICQRVGLLADGVVDGLMVQCDEIGRMLRALIRKLQYK
jgi:four helix bundle protein